MKNLWKQKPYYLCMFMLVRIPKVSPFLYGNRIVINSRIFYQYYVAIIMFENGARALTSDSLVNLLLDCSGEIFLSVACNLQAWAQAYALASSVFNDIAKLLMMMFSSIHLTHAVIGLFFTSLTTQCRVWECCSHWVAGCPPCSPQTNVYVYLYEFFPTSLPQSSLLIDELL